MVAFRFGSNSVAVFITLNNSLYASRLNSLCRNQWAISDSKNPIFDGSLDTACCMCKASEWQIHLSCIQKGGTAFSLDHTELLYPIMFDAPSVAKTNATGMTLATSFYFLINQIEYFFPVASCTGIKPKNPVTISFLLSLKNRNNIHKCFCVEMSVDSSKMMQISCSESHQWDQFSVQAKWCFWLSMHSYFYVTLCAPVYFHAHVLPWLHSDGQLYVSHNGRFFFFFFFL